jgi:RimJ/RimL family protein N-acetyltransferase
VTGTAAPPPISSERLSLVALTPDLLATMSGDGDEARPFDWPMWWPDDGDRRVLTVWRSRAAQGLPDVTWGPRALVDGDGRMVGHAGFHRPPAPMDRALDDPTFVGRRDPAAGGVVEIGYTIFPMHRGQGYASEAVRALVDWARATGEVGTVLAAVAADNTSSMGVLGRAGGFVEIGRCRSDDGEVEIVYRRDIGPAT